MNNILKDRVVIITGAGQGLGRTHALYLAGLGARAKYLTTEQNNYSNGIIYHIQK